MSNRPSKRIRRANMVVHIGASGSLEDCDETTTVLNIRDNHRISSISNMKFLTIVSFVNSVVSNISECPKLYSITITNNSSIRIIECISAIEVSLSNCPHLEKITIPNASTISFDNCPKLLDINCKQAIRVSLKNMNIQKKLLNFKNTFPNMNSVILENVVGIKEYPINELPISNLSMKNCDVERISKIDGFENLIVENCTSLRIIEEMYNIISLVATNCPYLYRIASITAIDTIKLERCPSLRGVAFIFTSVMIVDYCFSLVTLPANHVKKLTINRCPTLTSLNICNSTKEVLIDHCEQLEFVEFDVIDAFSFSDLSMIIYGDNRLYDIKDWYVSQLTICDNPSLEVITSVYNLNDLTVVNCIDLNMISNLVILNNLSIEGCQSLESIIDICGISSFAISSCEGLKEVNLYLTELEDLNLNDCENIVMSINGSKLNDLRLINCGFVSISDLTSKTRIHIQNTRLMPNMSSDINSIDTPFGDIEPFYPEAEQLILHFDNLNNLSKLLANQIKTYNLRKKYLKYIEKKRSHSCITCCICLDDIKYITCSMTSCSHLFHANCLNRWVSVKRACPLCNNIL